MAAVSPACPMNRPILSLLVALALASVASQPLAAEQAHPAHNPLIWADVPDMAMILVGKTYYSKRHVWRFPRRADRTIP